MARPPKIHIIKTRLADGTRAEYHYAWRGGPRLTGAPGTPEYHRSLAQALETSPTVKKGEFLSLIVAYMKSADFKKLGDHTTRAYNRHLDEIKERFGDMPLKALDDRRCRRDFIEYRDTMADRPRTADMAMGVLKRVLSWSVSAGYIDTNQAEPIERLHRTDKSENIWTGDDIAAFNDRASAPLKLALQLAIFTGLRQSDLIKLTWFEDKGDAFVVRTHKRNKTAIIPITPECRVLLDTLKRTDGPILRNSLGKAWTADGLRASFGKACDAAKVTRTFHDLRRTAATTLLASGIDSARVALLMGWSEKDVEQLLKIYVSRSEIVKSVLASLNQSRYENAPATELVK
ncbi:tyrosine-type recombinase/integrase [Asticcacaulis sp. ZE23SCel15]|uniref:tyrosine-type recombinase/integrase n=1 Tax=Asticcacaulis sp. ZE23SCel15 TaxID=3059027 RepID=UPI00265E1847|nr:tyrosine-type recombinase/integrase [Asticcacaulis sp. ZE23SCel15]WKL57280.1 tyrosine-type recombinase/integrase [Asticcacaulis sp. ZE23SCel15]